MGYFNYFIKCIIRNITYRLCKPKVLFTILLSLFIFFSMKHFGFCVLSDLDYEMISDGFSTITSNQGTIISQLSSVGVDVSQIFDELRNINLDIEQLKTTSANIESQTSVIISRLENLNSNIVNIYNKLDTNQRELLNTLNTNNSILISEMQIENQKLINELKLIREAINGTEEENSSFTDLGLVINNENTVFLKFFSINYEPRYTYVVKIHYNNPHPNAYNVFSYASDNMIPQNFNYYDYANDLYYAGTVPGNSTDYVITYTVPQIASNPKYIGFTWGLDVTKIEVLRSINGIVENLNESNSLQQQQNQLQQEQNNLLKDDNVNTDNLEFAQDDTNNPTSDGFNNLFLTIYNAFCNTSSSPLTVTLPFINESFTISPNLVSDGMNKMRSWSYCYINTFFLLL